MSRIKSAHNGESHIYARIIIDIIIVSMVNPVGSRCQCLTLTIDPVTTGSDSAHAEKVKIAIQIRMQNIAITR